MSEGRMEQNKEAQKNEPNKSKLQRKTRGTRTSKPTKGVV